ncbi:DUF4340 domain-containing protein, partial [Candidatus Falkowbacteria bacterium]|nr:DUF4340 domain-containing protein [Candidatus Falkowbacteria bacterium]
MESQPKKRFKSTYILAIIFLVLIAIFWITRGEDEGEKIRLFFKGINIDAVTKIEIVSGGEGTVLERDGSGWVVAPRPGSGQASQGRAEAEINYVAGILAGVKEMEVGDVVSEDAEKKGLFEVDETGVVVKLYQGGEILEHFYIGKFGTDYNSNYIRKEGSDEIYVTKGIVRSEFDRQDFRSLRLLFFMPDTVTKVSLKYKKEDQEDVVLEKRGGEWLVNNLGADGGKVGEFLTYVADLESPDIIELEEGNPSTGSGAPLRSEETGFSDPQ